MVKTPAEIKAEAEEQKKAAEAASAPAAPTIESEADLDRRFTAMLEADAQADREREERRLARQAIARNLSDLGGVFTDMIKANEGAVVSPRSVEQHYQRLDDRQKMIYDTYRARIDAIRQGKLKRDMARGAEARAAEARAKEKEEDRQLRKDLADQNDEFKRWKTEQDNAARIKVAQERALASIRIQTAKDGTKNPVVPYAGQDYVIDKAAFNGRMAQLYSYLKANNLFSKDSGAETDELKSVLMLFNAGQGSKAEESSWSKLAAACMVSIQGIPATDEHAADIVSILNGTYGKKPAAAAPKTTSSGSLYQVPTKK